MPTTPLPPRRGLTKRPVSENPAEAVIELEEKRAAREAAAEKPAAPKRTGRSLASERAASESEASQERATSEQQAPGSFADLFPEKPRVDLPDRIQVGTYLYADTKAALEERLARTGETRTMFLDTVLRTALGLPARGQQ